MLPKRSNRFATTIAIERSIFREKRLTRTGFDERDTTLGKKMRIGCSYYKREFREYKEFRV